MALMAKTARMALTVLMDVALQKLRSTQTVSLLLLTPIIQA
jgi:hypothetical protein